MIYLDHAATSLPRLGEAIEAATLAANWANPQRGLNSAQAEATLQVEAARRAVLALVTGSAVYPDPKSADRSSADPSRAEARGRVCCFLSGATAALNQAISGLFVPGTLVATDPLAHNATRRPLHKLGARTWTLPHDAVGHIDLSRAAKEWPSNVGLVVVTHGSNVTGLIQPVAELVALAHSRGARVVVDAAQTAGLLFPLEVGDADAIAFSAHKALRGLPGIGVLLLNEGAPIEPLIVGGSGADALSDDMPAELPDRLEAGTRNLPGIAAFAAAAAAVAKPTTGRSPSAWRDQADALREAVRRSGATIAGRGELPVVAFTMAGHAPQEIEEMLDRVFGIVSRAGLHCAPEAHRTLGTLPLGAVRVSSGATTTNADLDALTTALASLQKHAGFTDAVLR